MKKHYLFLFCACCIFSCTEKTTPLKTYALFVGTYTQNGSEGIYRYTFNTDNGALTNKALAATLENPSFIKISPDKKNLYAVQETDNYDSVGGAVTAFVFNKDSIMPLNTLPTGGAHPCHIGISKKGHVLAVSNYTGGSLAIYAIEENGRLQANKQLIDHKVIDSSKASHVHAAKFTQDGLFVADLGLDALKRYVSEGAWYVPAVQASLELPPGAGPRHFTFSKDNQFLYVINELNSTITVFVRNQNGSYNQVETQSTVAEDFSGESFCADIHLSKNGKFLYGSNRGENTIVIFKVDGTTGKLTLMGRESVRGDWPRNFVIDPTGNFLLVANQRSDNITIFKRDHEKGTLSFLHNIELPNPVCLEFLE